MSNLEPNRETRSDALDNALTSLFKDTPQDPPAQSSDFCTRGATEEIGGPVGDLLAWAARVRELGPSPARVRVAPDVWSATRSDQDRDRPLLAPPPVLMVPVEVVDELPPGGWEVVMSDGTVRSWDDPPAAALLHHDGACEHPGEDCDR